ncbi:MAG: lycopene cyclase domain-containing protein [Anaerolineae bacterium]|nr:MAG: lycopene cyclase domain-containing protein [Anaerolineae bacterium]
MTYFAFLLYFLVVPILILSILTYHDWRKELKLPSSLSLMPAWWIVGILIGIALVYTTPWDNYLVATGVWSYDPALVTGITLGWVPLEEYTFFILQPIMTGLWLLFLARRVHPNEAFFPQLNIRLASVAVIGIAWLTSIGLFISGWKSVTYLSLELMWGLPAIMVQLAFGADILWHNRRLIASAILIATLYLCFADSIAIQDGTWTINPDLSLHILFGGILPIEEVIFFLLTNTLVVFGIVLGLTPESSYRLPSQIMNQLTHSQK